MCRIENIDPGTDRLTPARAFSYGSPKRQILLTLILIGAGVNAGGMETHNHGQRIADMEIAVIGNG
jgi:hypothetical protein